MTSFHGWGWEILHGALLPFIQDGVYGYISWVETGFTTGSSTASHTSQHVWLYFLAIVDVELGRAFLGYLPLSVSSEWALCLCWFMIIPSLVPQVDPGNRLLGINGGLAGFQIVILKGLRSQIESRSSKIPDLIIRMLIILGHSNFGEAQSWIIPQRRNWKQLPFAFLWRGICLIYLYRSKF